MAATATMHPTNGSIPLDPETAVLMLATGDPSPIPNPAVAPPIPGLLEFNMLGVVVGVGLGFTVTGDAIVGGVTLIGGAVVVGGDTLIGGAVVVGGDTVAGGVLTGVTVVADAAYTHEPEPARLFTGGGAAEIAAGGEGIPLVVAVEGVGGVVLERVRVIAARALLNCGAIRSADPAGVIQRRLNALFRRSALRHAPSQRTGGGRRSGHGGGICHRRRRRGDGDGRSSGD
ncbi:hypothetical protein SASPL_133920 [Salvia splendens]|uniref:Uncharacterized protein n=1 Tax=Salvia splendens TaxID=180675 RepID=A0A8X8X280_SALSN|nr:hypothetical protein SASPL_133920 [Salvia splendens]